MLRPTLGQAMMKATTTIKTKPQPIMASRLHSTAPTADGKARVEQIVQQARSASPVAYKTVKEKPGQDEDAVRRAQLIWLARKSLADGRVVKKEVLSPHEQSWVPNTTMTTTTPTVQRGYCCDGDAVPRVWPHLW